MSMDGKGSDKDNIMVERLWCTVKYEHMYIHEFTNVQQLSKSCKRYFNWYNEHRSHQGLQDCTPDEVYYQPNVQVA